jgi:RNA polymerase sigma-70 factor (ECF subfamily)
MPPQRREVFIMRRLHGMSAKEVGAALKISPAAVDAHVARAVLALHKEMAALDRSVNG